MSSATVLRDAWPALPFTEWKSTWETFLLRTQIVGKTRLVLAPHLNHSWNTTLYVSTTGLTTSLMPYQDIGVEVALDLVHDELVVTTTAGERRTAGLGARSIADFYAEYLSCLHQAGVDVTISATPNELVEAIPFARDRTHVDYDPEAVHRYWLALVQVHRVLSRFRSRYRGKASPVHYFWGAGDLATTRFSGRPAPLHPGGAPNCPDYVMQEAYSDEVSSCGFWPSCGSEGAFYSYAYPEPPGFREHEVAPAAACYDETLGEFVLPYEAVRTADDPDARLMDFLTSTYDAARELAHWEPWPEPALEGVRVGGRRPAG